MRADISSSAKVLLAIIVDHIGNNSRSWPGTRLLSRESGLDRTTVLACIAKLEEVGLLTVERTGNGKRNYYRLPGGETPPVGKSNQSENPTDTGSKTPPEAVGNLHHNQTDQVTRPRKKRAADKPPPDPRIRDFIAWFCEAFEKARGVKYIVQGAKDGATVKRLLSTLAPDEIKSAAHVMLADDWGGQRASIGLLSSQINAWRGKTRKTGNGRPGFTPAPAGQSYNGLAKRFE